MDLVQKYIKLNKKIKSSINSEDCEHSADNFLVYLYLSCGLCFSNNFLFFMIEKDLSTIPFFNLAILTVTTLFFLFFNEDKNNNIHEIFLIGLLIITTPVIPYSFAISPFFFVISFLVIRKIKRVDKKLNNKVKKLDDIYLEILNNKNHSLDYLLEKTNPSTDEKMLISKILKVKKNDFSEQDELRMLMNKENNLNDVNTNILNL